MRQKYGLEVRVAVDRDGEKTPVSVLFFVQSFL